MSQGSQRQDAAGGDGQITWVGEQRLMEGYCGRASGGAVTTTLTTLTATTSPTATPTPTVAAQPTGTAGRPIAAARGRARRRDLIVRVAPPRPAPPDVSVPLEAA